MDNHTTHRQSDEAIAATTCTLERRETTAGVIDKARHRARLYPVQPDYARLGLGSAWEAEGRN